MHVESPLIVHELGTVFLFLPLMIVMALLSLLCKPCCNKSRYLHKKNTSLQASIKGNMWIRFLMEAFLDISIGGTLNLMLAFRNGDMPWSSLFHVINSITLIVLFSAAAVFPVFICVFYCRSFARWNDPDFDQKYGAVFEGLRKDRRSSLLYPLIFSVRRILLTLLAFFFSHDFFIQVNLMNLLTSIQLIYLIHCKPFEDP